MQRCRAGGGGGAARGEEGGRLVEAADRSRPRGGTVARGKCRIVVSTPPAGSTQLRLNPDRDRRGYAERRGAGECPPGTAHTSWPHEPVHVSPAGR
jgi:hypothetical protein